MHCYSSTFDKGQKQEVNGNRSTQPRPLLLPFCRQNPLAFSNRINECLHDNCCPGQQVMLSVLPQQLNATRQAYQP